MDVSDQLRGIDAVAVEVMDLRSRNHAKRTAGSRRRGYEKALREVRTVAGRQAADELAAWIESEIRRKRAMPPAREVRQQGARICRAYGYPVSTGSWLGA